MGTSASSAAKPAATSAHGSAGDRREELLAKVVDYVVEHGVADLTLRSLATAVGSNNRMLLYYFGSRDELITEALEGAATHFPGINRVIGIVDDDSTPIEQRITSAWEIIADPANLPHQRLFFEIFGLAAFERERFAPLLTLIGTEWASHVSGAYARLGVPEATATLLGNETVALWRGLQATLVSINDVELVNRVAEQAHASLVSRVRTAARL